MTIFENFCRSIGCFSGSLLVDLQRLQKLICLHLSTDCFMKISLQIDGTLVDLVILD